MRRHEQGFTLVEMLVACSIMVIVVTASMSVLLAAQRASQTGVSRTDRVQVLRTGMKQIADDLAFARWDDSTATNGHEFSVYGYLPEIDRTSALWSGLDAEWPGDASGQSTEWPWSQVKIRYVLKETSLIREISSDSYGVIYYQEAVASDLIPWSSDGTGSYLTVEPGSRKIGVMLRTPQQEQSGVSGVAEIYSLFYMEPSW